MSTLSVNTVKSLNTNAPVFQNSSGTEKGQLAKAWVNFDGTAVTSGNDLTGVRDHFNISAVVDEAVGCYTIFFNTNMNNEKYSIVGSVGGTTGFIAHLHLFDEVISGSNPIGLARTDEKFRIILFNTAHPFSTGDCAQINLAVFGD